LKGLKMPNCFNLIRKGDDSPTPPAKIDEELCTLLNVEIHPTNYVFGWYDVFGFELAMGKGWDGIAKQIDGYETEDIAKGETRWMDSYVTYRKILQYLRDNYVSDAWAEIGRR